MFFLSILLKDVSRQKSEYFSVCVCVRYLVASLFCFRVLRAREGGGNCFWYVGEFCLLLLLSYFTVIIVNLLLPLTSLFVCCCLFVVVLGVVVAAVCSIVYLTGGWKFQSGEGRQLLNPVLSRPAVRTALCHACCTCPCVRRTELIDCVQAGGRKHYKNNVCCSQRFFFFLSTLSL